MSIGIIILLAIVFVVLLVAAYLILSRFFPEQLDELKGTAGEKFDETKDKYL